MKTRYFLFFCLLKFSLLLSFAYDAQSQKIGVVNLKEGFRQNPFSLNAKTIYTANYEVPFLDTNKFQVIKKGIIHYQPYQYIWQNYKAGKFSLDTIKYIIKVFSVDTTALSTQPLNSTIYLLLVYDKVKKDTAVALNSKLTGNFNSWKLVSLNSINRDFKQINTGTRRNYFKFNSIEFYENSSVIKRSVFISLFVDTTSKKIFQGLMILDSYFTYGSLSINSNTSKIAVYNKFRTHYFNEQSTEIRIIDQQDTRVKKQSYKIGDTIHIYGHDVRFSKISFDGKRMEYTDLGKSKANIVGFNIGYKYPSINYVEIISGKFYNTDKLLQEKKYILIDFWGTWCKPCIEGIPDLIKIYEKYKQDIELISIASERKMDTSYLINAIKKYKMNWHHVLVNNAESNNTNSILHQYRIDSYPSFLIVNNDGKILLRTIGFKNTEIINKMLEDKLGY